MSRKLFTRLWERPDEPYIRPILQLDRTESIDSNATAPNNPGPGRNVGRLYDFLGDGLERVLKKTTKQKRKTLSIIPFKFRQEVDDSESVDTNATASNNPGPGRNVGLVFESVGKKIEHALNRTAGRLKLGPAVVAWEIRNVRHYYRESFFVDRKTDTSGAPTYDELRIIKRLCRKLLKYCR